MSAPDPISSNSAMTNREALLYAIEMIREHGVRRDVAEWVDGSLLPDLEKQETAINRLSVLANAPDIEAEGHGREG